MAVTTPTPAAAAARGRFRGSRTRKRIVLKGDLPSPMDAPPGCRFHTRCPVATEICSRVEPPLAQLGSKDTLVACHHPGAEI